MAVSYASLLSMTPVSAPRSFSRGRSMMATCSLPSPSGKSALGLALSSSSFLSGSISLSTLHPVGRGLDSRIFSVRAMAEPDQGPPKVTKKVFLDIKIGQSTERRIIKIGLYGDEVPVTVENFRTLCTGKRGFSYKDSFFDDVNKSFYIRGGKFKHKDGTNGRSIYSTHGYEDKNTREYEAKAGNIVMEPITEEGTGKITYGSEFSILINQDRRPALIVFGEVLDGMDVVNLIAAQEDADTHQPKTEVKIINCGELDE